MENKKMTKKQYFEALAEVVSRAGVENEVDLLAFIDRQVELLEKKSGVKTKAQKENEEIVKRVYEVLQEIGKPVTATELAKAMGEDFSNQKASAMLKKLVEAGQVVRTEDKRKAYFSVNAE